MEDCTEDFWSTGSGARKRTWKMVPSEGAQVVVDVACTYKDDVPKELMACVLLPRLLVVRSEASASPLVLAL